MRRVLLLCLLLGCRKERAEVKSDPAATAPKRVTCTIAEEDPIVTKVEVPARCDLTVKKTRHIGPGGLLSIAPGAKLSFVNGAGLLVEGGAIVARGTKEEPIVFGSVSQQPQPGDWIGLRFSYVVKTPLLPDAEVAEAAASSLEHFVVEHAGAKVEGDDVPAAIFVGGRDSTSVRLAHGRIQKNAATGLRVAPSSAFAGAEDVVFADDGGLSFDGDPTALASISGSKFGESIRLFGTVDRPLVLPAAGGYVFGRVSVANRTSPASLTIPEASIVKFDKNGALEIGEYFGGAPNATLIAKKVTFTSAAATPAAGDWVGIELHDGCNATIEDAIVEYTGHKPGTATRGGIEIPSDAKSISVVRTTFRNLAGPAFTAESCKPWIDPAKGNVYTGGKLCEEVVSPASVLGTLGGSGSISSIFGPSAGGIIGTGDGSSFGAGGLGLSGVGGGGGFGSGSGFGHIGKAPGPKVREVSVTSKGNLPIEVVRRILRSRLGVLRACYGSSTLTGTIAVQLDIDAKGNVSKVTKTGGTLTDATIASCVTSALRTVTFPEPDGGTVTTQATWDFSPP